MSTTEEVQEFKISNSSDTFSAKSDDVFGCLAALEKKHESFQKSQASSSSDSEDTDLVKADPNENDYQTIEKAPIRSLADGRGGDRQHRDRDGFTVPRGRGRGYRGRKIPDFKSHPNKWTKYSLEDVSGSDMSESSTTRAAFEFLDERRKMREMTENPTDFLAANVEETACSKGAITFKRSKDRKDREASSKTDKGISLPRIEDLEENDQDDREKTDDSLMDLKVSFKKGKKRNIRSRQLEDGDEDDETGGLAINSEVEAIGYMCPECGKCLTCLSDLNKHMAIHDGDGQGGLFQCDACGKLYVSARYLKNHVLKVHRKSPQTCDQCGTHFKSKNALSNHVRFKHKERGEVCAICSKTFKDAYGLRRHMTKHSKQKESCLDCGKQVKRLHEHQKTCKKRLITESVSSDI